MTQANELLAKRRLVEAKKQYEAAKTAAEQCLKGADVNDPATVLIIGPLRRKLAELHGTLELEGLELKPLGELKPPPESRPRPAAAKPAPAAPPRRAGDGVSFRSDVAPVLVGHCARCHAGAKPKGQFSLETFAALMTGVDGSAVIDPGRSKESRLIEIIASGEMPKGDKKVSPAELAILTKWIDQGAKFDGADRDEQLAKSSGAVAPGPPASAAATPSPPPRGEIAFSTHVAPLLATHCVKCHGGQQPRNRLSMESFTQLMRGGMAGAAIMPGNAPRSLLVQKLKGTASDGQRMPLDADPLPAAQIALIEQWIAAGAKFDGPDPTKPLAEVVALGAARGATHEELGRLRAEAAARNWRLAIPDDASRTATTDNFLLVGNVPQPRLESIAAEAERLAGLIRAALSLPNDKPLVHGRLTIYAMANRYDYTEFALMVERRSRLPRGQRGHWRYTVADAYALVTVPANESDSDFTSLLTEQIAAAAVASRWSVPPWLATGFGRAIAAPLPPKDAPPGIYDERLVELLSEKPSVDDWLSGKLPAEDADILGYGLARHLLASGAKMRNLAQALERGRPLDEALMRSHGQPLKELAANWLASPAPKPPRRR